MPSAPSPSRTMACANWRATVNMACNKAWPSALCKLVIGGCWALLVAITTKESLVEVSPSTVMRLKEPSASANDNSFINTGATHASVAT